MLGHAVGEKRLFATGTKTSRSYEGIGLVLEYMGIITSTLVILVLEYMGIIVQTK